MFLRVLVLLYFVHLSQSANILCAFTTPAVSHLKVFDPIYRELSSRGHQVTVLSPLFLNNGTISNITQIEVPAIFDVVKQYKDRPKRTSKDKNLLSILSYIGGYQRKYVEKMFIHIAKIFPKGAKFDLILVDNIAPLIYGLSCRFKAPIIGMVTNVALSFQHDLFGNPDHPVLYPDLPTRTEGKMSFYEKVTSVVNNILCKLHHHWIYIPSIDKISKKHFGNHCPNIANLIKNISLVLLNSGQIIHPVRPTIPTVVETGGVVHLQEKDKLPDDLQTYLDHSSRGVIYFSLGSISKNSDLSDTQLSIITEALAELPYDVLWKWELDTFPNKPKNVMIKKWLPQQAVLRHRNVKVFVNHGGSLSVEESIVNLVPIVAIPLMLDQPDTAKRVVESGIGLSMDYLTMTKEKLKKAVMEVAKRKKYRNALKRVKSLLQDKPIHGLDQAVWWIEYVIRHKNTSHLRSSSISTSWYTFYYLDVMGIVIFVLIIIFCSIYLILNLLKFIIRN